MLVGARSSFCCGHKLPQHKEVHGHSYEVWAYTAWPVDAEQWQSAVAKACGKLDHRMINDIIPEPTMENIARHISQTLKGVSKIRVVRPVEGLSCEFDPPAHTSAQ